MRTGATEAARRAGGRGARRHRRPAVDARELERLLAEEEEIERRTRGEHHETPHFPKEVD